MTEVSAALTHGLAQLGRLLAALMLAIEQLPDVVRMLIIVLCVVLLAYLTRLRAHHHRRTP